MSTGTCHPWLRRGGGGRKWRTCRPQRVPRPPPRSPSRRRRPCCTCQGVGWRWCANFCPCWPTLARTAFISTSTSLGQVSEFSFASCGLLHGFIHAVRAKSPFLISQQGRTVVNFGFFSSQLPSLLSMNGTRVCTERVAQRPRGGCNLILMTGRSSLLGIHGGEEFAFLWRYNGREKVSLYYHWQR
jgi:hypothetical protein